MCVAVAKQTCKILVRRNFVKKSNSHFFLDLETKFLSSKSGQILNECDNIFSATKTNM